MKLTITQLEKRVTEINEWLQNNPNSTFIKQKEQSRNYYVWKLQQMDELGIKIIKI